MSFKDCINRGVDAGELDADRAREAEDLFDEIEREFQGRMGHGEAARQAALETVAAIRRQVAEKKRQLLLQTKAWRRIEKDMRTYRNAKGEEDLGGGILAMLDRDELATFSNVVARREAIRGRLHARMTEVLATFRRDLAGRVRNKATLLNMAREVFGTDTGDTFAKQLAGAWGEAAEFARLRFNAAGGRIPKRADWGMPQSHDTLRVRPVGFDAWREFILPRLDREKMLDELTGLPMSPARLELALREVYETVRTDGFSKLRPSGAPGGRKLANRRADHRFLAFRDADGWLEYQERFGAGDPFSIMLSHLDGMARDIALMETLGPNPQASLRFMGQLARKRGAELDAAAGTDRHGDRAAGRIRLADDMFAHLSGAASAPIDGMVARTFAGLRSALQSMQLGSAAISAITDLNFQRLAARHAGIPEAKVLGQVINLLNPLNLEDQKLAVRLGLIAENWATLASAQARYMGEVTGPEISRRLADAVLRISGLSPWTQAGRWAFGMEFMGFLGDQVGKGFDDLRPALQATFRKYGLGPDAWNLIRRTELYEHEGATFLRPDDIATSVAIPGSLADDLATKVLEMVQTETEFAVPSSSLRGRVMLISDAQPGTFQGELLRSVAMYKNFAVTLAFTHVRRALLQKGALNKGRMFANLAISTTLMGGLALQMKEISKGRDPRPMFGDKKGEFWTAAMLQGGGLGIFGDFLFSGLNRMDRGLGVTLAGPVVGFFDDVRRLTLGNLAQLPGEDPTNFGREAAQFLGRYTPGGSVWFARLGYERLIIQELQRFIDPNAHRRFRDIQMRFRREFGQRYFWRPGRKFPDRSPDVEVAIKPSFSN